HALDREEPVHPALGGRLTLEAQPLPAGGGAAPAGGPRARGSVRAVLPGPRTQVVPLRARAARRRPPARARGLPRAEAGARRGGRRAGVKREMNLRARAWVFG